MNSAQFQVSPMLSLLKQLAEIETPSSEKTALDQLGNLIAEHVEAMSAQVVRFPQASTGDHILARWGNGKGGILLLCHMDTVFPIGMISKMPLIRKDGKFFGPGVLDMKGGIVIALKAVEALLQSGEMPGHPIQILFTSDEESGSHTSRPIIESLALESDMVFVMESALPDGSIKTWRKGVGGFTITVKGKSAHAGGSHQDGRNAIEELAHQVIAIQGLTNYSKGTTLSVGVIRGGTVSNVVPDEAIAEVDLRILQAEEWDSVNQAMLSLQPVLEGTEVHVSGHLNRPPMPAGSIILAAFEKAENIATQIGLQLHAGGSGGGSDGNFVAPLGKPILDGLGPVGDHYHSEKEYIVIDSLPERARLMACLLRDWMK